MLKRAPTLLALFLSTTALAQTRQPAQITTTPSATPQTFDVLDKAGQWLMFGTSANGVWRGFGGELNLKSFGAKCDGVADDTTAMQAWLNAVGPGLQLRAPGGTCKFTGPLTVGAVSRYTIEGAGAATTVFSYSGTDPTATLLTVNAPNAASVNGITLRDFRIVSNLVMTGGFAIQMNRMFASVVDNVYLDASNLGNGNLCGGAWFNGASLVDVLSLNAQSWQNCGDGVRVNDNSGANAELRLIGGNIGGNVISGVPAGFLNGIHVAGGFGGAYCLRTNVHNNQIGALIDTSVVAINNRETELLCPMDGNNLAGVKVNDTLVSGGTLDLGGWYSSTYTGHGVEINAFANGKVEVRGNEIYNNCLSGIYTADLTTHILVAANVAITGNGNSGATGCPASQAAHPGFFGYGIASNGLNSNIVGLAGSFGNTVGNAKNVVGLTRTLGSLAAAQYITVGGVPVVNGTCAASVGAWTGGSTAAKATASATCTGGLTFNIGSPTAPTGWACRLADLTTPANKMEQTGSNTLNASFTGTFTSGDVLLFGPCVGY